MGQKGSREAQEAPRAQDRQEDIPTAAAPQEDASPAPAPAPLADFTQDSSDDEPPAKRAKKADPAPSGSAPSTVRAPPPVILTGGIERTSDRNNRLFLTFMQDHPRVNEDFKDLSYYKILCGCRFDGFRGDTLGNALEHFVSPEWKEMPNEWKEAQARKDFRVVMQTTSKLLADADLEPNVSLERKGWKPEERMRVRIVMMHPFMVASAFKLWPFDPEWKDL